MNNSIAVIIPCFNSSGTLSKSIESVMNQSVPVDEIVVVDDCSKDSKEVESICNLYDCVKYIKNTKNLGLAGTRNIGISSINSEIVAFLDSDDQYHVNKIEYQLKFLRHQVVVSTEVKKIDHNSKTYINENLNLNYRYKIFKSPFQNLFSNRLVGSSLMAYTSTLKSLNGYDSSLRSVEDFDLWIRILNQGIKVVKIKLPLYLYYDTEGSLSKDSISIWNNIVIAVSKFLFCSNINKGSFTEQIIWLILLSKEYIKAEATRNIKLKKQLILDSIKFLPNKLVMIIFKTLLKLKLFKLLSFLLIRF